MNENHHDVDDNASFGDVAAALFDPDECVAVCTQVPGGPFVARTMAAAAAADFVVPAGEHVYFGVNPVHTGVSGRGSEQDVTRLAALWADLDVKAGGFADLEAAQVAVDQLSEILGTQPAFITQTGHGLHPMWLLDPDDPETVLTTDDDRRRLREVLTRWRRVVTEVAARQGAAIDNVFDLTRILRAPGSDNVKDPDHPLPVMSRQAPGVRLRLAEVVARLDGVDVAAAAHSNAPGLPDGTENWPWAGSTCPYVTAMVSRWAVDRPTAGRHPWLLDSTVRLLAARRAGCITEVDYQRALDMLGKRFVELLQQDPARSEAPGERKEIQEWATNRVVDMSEDDLQSQLGRHSHDSDPDKAGAAQKLVTIAHEIFRLGRTPDDEAFAVEKTRPHLAIPFGQRDPIQRALTRAYRRKTRKVVNQNALTDALRTLEGDADDEAPQELHLRVAAHGDAVYIDTANAQDEVVVIQGGTWSIVRGEDVPVLFRRTRLTRPMSTPVPGGDLEELWRIVNVATADRPLVLAFLVAALIAPDIPHPVLALFGEQGTGKSTAARILVALLDPSDPELRKPPRGVDDWVTAAQSSYVVAVDNLSSLSEWFSDSLCRAVTGEGDVRRRLYTDGGVVVFSFRRVIILNGIDVGSLRGDLAERVVMITLERIDAASRKLEANLAREWDLVLPKVFGALLTLAAKVHARHSEVHLQDPPRMADFALILAAVDEVLGLEDAGLARYRHQGTTLSSDSIGGIPFLVELTSRVRRPWEGSSAELHERVKQPDHVRARDWPNDARQVTSLLRRSAPALRSLGWTVEDLGKNNKAGVLRWRLEPPEIRDEEDQVRKHQEDDDHYEDDHVDDGYEDDGYEDDGYEDDGYEDDGYEDDGYEDDGYEDEEWWENDDRRAWMYKKDDQGRGEQ